ncbi:MAG: ABC transporter substrate-binding protein [Alteraurantiacibacter sp.]
MASHLFTRITGAALTAALLASCGAQDDGTLDVALIGDADSIYTTSLRLSGSAQHLRAATQSGLVGLNAEGEVVPALAETWLPADDGLSFIFRLRAAPWPNGEPMTAQSARDALVEAIDGLEGTSLGQDLAPIEEVRALAGRVVEVRLSTPEPYLLQLLAQPELALRREEGGTGAMLLKQSVEDESMAMLEFKPPDTRGMAMDEDWLDDVQEVALRVSDARQAIALFDDNAVELVLGGTIGDFPMVETGPLSTGTLRVDTGLGLFGLRVMNADGVLSDEAAREGLAMALDRDEVMRVFGLGGWPVSTRPVNPGLPNDPGLVAERWQGEELEDLRATAAARIAAAREGGEGPVRLSLAMAEGPGWNILFDELAAQYATVGVELVRARSLREADLAIVDRIARYPSPRWYLGQFRCTLGRGLCSEAADTLAAQAMTQSDPQARATLMAQAEAELTLQNIYIPIGRPLRWSLARGNVEGFASNVYAFHPLPPMATRPR